MPEGSPGQGRPSPLRSAGLRSLGAAGRIASGLPRPAPAARVHPAPAPPLPGEASPPSSGGSSPARFGSLRPAGLAARFARRRAPGAAPGPAPPSSPSPMDPSSSPTLDAVPSPPSSGAPSPVDRSPFGRLRGALSFTRRFPGAPAPSVAEAPVPGIYDEEACAPAPAPAPGTDVVLWDEYSNASTAPAPAPSIEDDEETYESQASRRSLAESVQEAIEKAKDGKEKAALCIAGLWLYACVTEKLVEDDEPLILPSDSESSDEEIVEEGEATCCFGMLAVVPEDERDWRLLGGLVEVPEDLREFDRDGRILAIQESNVVLVVILALTFADLAVTALATYPQVAPILAGNCPMIEREGDGPVDAGGNALKGWDYNGDGACCDEFDGFLEPGTCGTGKGHGKVLDTPRTVSYTHLTLPTILLV